MNVKAPAVYVCDVHGCIHNNGEGDCQKTSLTIGDDGICSYLNIKEEVSNG